MVNKFTTLHGDCLTGLPAKNKLTSLRLSSEVDQLRLRFGLCHLAGHGPRRSRVEDDGLVRHSPTRGLCSEGAEAGPAVGCCVSPEAARRRDLCSLRCRNVLRVPSLLIYNVVYQWCSFARFWPALFLSVALADLSHHEVSVACLRAP